MLTVLSMNYGFVYLDGEGGEEEVVSRRDNECGPLGIAKAIESGYIIE